MATLWPLRARAPLSALRHDMMSCHWSMWALMSCSGAVVGGTRRGCDILMMDRGALRPAKFQSKQKKLPRTWTREAYVPMARIQAQWTQCRKHPRSFMYGNVQMSKKQMQPNPRSPCVPFGKESSKWDRRTSKEYGTMMMSRHYNNTHPPTAHTQMHTNKTNA